MMNEYVVMLRFCVDKPLIILHHLLVPLVGFPALMITRHHRTFILMANLHHHTKYTALSQRYLIFRDIT